MRRMIRLVMALACLCVYFGMLILIQLCDIAPWLSFLYGSVLIPLLLEIHDGFCYFFLKGESHVVEYVEI